MAAFKFVFAFLNYVEIQRMQKRYIFWKNIDVVVTKKPRKIPPSHTQLTKQP